MSSRLLLSQLQSPFVPPNAVRSSPVQQLPSSWRTREVGCKRGSLLDAFAAWTLLIEFCASADSELTKHVPYGSAALRITDKEDFTKTRTLEAILTIIRIARKMMSRLQFGLLLHVHPDVPGSMLMPPRVSLQATRRFPTN